ncbi:unnamed protein product [Closterium sp. NIES-64]|nr:unnamed protein product [Closterium sp. NIES-64]
MDAIQAAALVNMKVVLGVLFPNWSLKGLGLTGSIHSEIFKLTTPTVLSVAFNYLTGSLTTALPTTLTSLDVQSNFLAGSVPANTIPYCASMGNFLVDASKCASLELP